MNFFDIVYDIEEENTQYIVACLGWLRCGFEVMNRFIGSSLVVTTNNYNTFKITVIMTHTSGLLFTSLVSTLH
jgi:hypothetical protein